MHEIDQLAAFVAVARTDSFTEAAAELGVSKATVSKRVQALEDALGLPLLHRTTRQVTATEVGQQLLDEVGPALDVLYGAKDALLDQQARAAGTIRLSAPSSYGAQTVAPALAEFLALHSQVRVEASFTDARVDLVAENIDLAIRIAELPDSTLRARRLGEMRRVVVASAAYVDKMGAPAHPSELSQHRCLRFAHRQSGANWSFCQGSGLPDLIVPVEGPVECDSGEALLTLVAGGVGVAQLPDFLVQGALDRGELVPLLTEWPERPRPIWAVLPPGKYVSPKVRLLMDFLADRIGGGAVRAAR